MALFIAGVFVVFRPDTNVPVVGNVIYRIGVLLGIVSLALTAIAVRESTFRRAPYVWAILSAAVAEYIFLEAMVAYEPGRLLLIALVAHPEEDESPKRRALRALKLSAPFVVLALPLMAYKVLFPPVGVYQSTYVPTPIGWADLPGRLT